jgi:dTMP kinase
MIKSKFITFEGGEGCGKSTQSKLLQTAFTSNSLKCYHTREPGGTESAELIRSLLVKGDVARWEKMTETLLHMAARKEHVEKVISPKLRQGSHIICDRFIDSTIAYQGYGHNVSEAIIRSLHQIVIGDFYPDLTIILDMKAEEGLMRTKRRVSFEDRYEKMDIEFHHRVREGFLELAKQNESRYAVINAARPINEIHGKIIDLVNYRLGIRLTKSYKDAYNISTNHTN